MARKIGILCVRIALVLLVIAVVMKAVGYSGLEPCPILPWKDVRTTPRTILELAELTLLFGIAGFLIAISESKGPGGGKGQ